MIPLVVALNIRSDDVLGLDDTNAVAGAFAAMIVLSIAAFLLVPRGARVPMQWGVTGKPTWTLAPGFAVLFVPLFAAAVLAALSLLNSAARASLPSLAMLFLLIHAVHLFFAVRYARRHG